MNMNMQLQIMVNECCHWLGLILVVVWCLRMKSNKKRLGRMSQSLNVMLFLMICLETMCCTVSVVAAPQGRKGNAKQTHGKGTINFTLTRYNILTSKFVYKVTMLTMVYGR